MFQHYKMPLSKEDLFITIQSALFKGATLAVNEIKLIIHNIDGTVWSCVHCRGYSLK